MPGKEIKASEVDPAEVEEFICEYTQDSVMCFHIISGRIAEIDEIICKGIHDGISNERAIKILSEKKRLLKRQENMRLKIIKASERRTSP